MNLNFVLDFVASNFPFSIFISPCDDQN